MLQNIINHLYNNRTSITEWLYAHGLANSKDIFYSSIDIRHSDEKITPVDMNLFPGGFNNINEELYPLAISAIETYFNGLNFNKDKLILLIPESHTRNQFYSKNITVFYSLLSQAGYNVVLGSLNQNLTYYENSDNGQPELHINKIDRKGDSIITSNGQRPDLIILNNDLSSGLPEILQNVEQFITPSVLGGWYNRLKSNFFTEYNLICKQFAQDFALDEWVFTSHFKKVDRVNFNEPKSLAAIQAVIDDMFIQLRQDYHRRQLNDAKPFLMIKADNGTYGMGIMSIEEGFNFTKLNRKDRNKMTTIKDSQHVSSVIIQEGIESILQTAENHIAEPVIYSIGPNTIGGFYRINNTKGKHDNLNSSGMYFTQMSLTEITTPVFFVYSLLAKLSIIAAQNEILSAIQS